MGFKDVHHFYTSSWTKVRQEKKLEALKSHSANKIKDVLHDRERTAHQGQRIKLKDMIDAFEGNPEVFWSN